MLKHSLNDPWIRFGIDISEKHHELIGLEFTIPKSELGKDSEFGNKYQQ